MLVEQRDPVRPPHAPRDRLDRRPPRAPARWSCPHRSAPPARRARARGSPGRPARSAARRARSPRPRSAAIRATTTARSAAGRCVSGVVTSTRARAADALGLRLADQPLGELARSARRCSPRGASSRRSRSSARSPICRTRARPCRAAPCVSRWSCTARSVWRSAGLGAVELARRRRALGIAHRDEIGPAARDQPAADRGQFDDPVHRLRATRGRGSRPPRRPSIRRSAPAIAARPSASRLLVGSSSSSRSGAAITARAIATRVRCPPLRLASGRSRSSPASPTSASAASIRASSVQSASARSARVAFARLDPPQPRERVGDAQRLGQRDRRVGPILAQQRDAAVPRDAAGARLDARRRSRGARSTCRTRCARPSPVRWRPKESVRSWKSGRPSGVESDSESRVTKEDIRHLSKEDGSGDRRLGQGCLLRGGRACPASAAIIPQRRRQTRQP